MNELHIFNYESSKVRVYGDGWFAAFDVCSILELSKEADAISFKEQTRAMEKDERQRILEEYLNCLLPENWDDMDLYYIRDATFYRQNCAKGTVERTSVSNAV